MQKRRDPFTVAASGTSMFRPQGLTIPSTKVALRPAATQKKKKAVMKPCPRCGRTDCYGARMVTE